ncbi:NAD(P)-dependent oxidoreductase [Alphaproteobacteria bacterium]|nr:NAD(P)-dependent oxidoreductase [Alphaproteobacteria bacterium]
MHKIGVVGLGDMGSGLAKNLIKNGFDTIGLDISEKRTQAFIEMGGKAAQTLKEVGAYSDAVFVMVMTGDQAKSVILGKDGLISNLKKGSVVILTATIKPSEATEIGESMKGSGIQLIDSPVSGGFPGAQNGTLTMMAAGEDKVLDQYKPVMEAVSKSIHRVGSFGGQGQIVKACLQSLIGSIFSATFEAAALAAKAGVKGDILYKVFSSSGAGCGVTNTALENIIDRKFFGTGSHISTMHKDLTISLNLAKELGVPMHMASTAMQLFHAGKTKYPQGDNWIVTKVIEEIIGAELHR